MVDDVEESRDGIERLLRSDGYVIETVRSEAAAIETAARRSRDLVLIDLGHPRQQAITTARRIRQQGMPNSTVPIVLFCIEWAAGGQSEDMGDNLYIAPTTSISSETFSE